MSNVPSLATYDRWDGECPGNHQFSTLDNFAFDPNDRNHSLFQRAASKLINEWNGDQFAGLLLSGNPGTGKSHAAIALARALHENGADVFYRFVPELPPHGGNVSDWTAPRITEPNYSYNGASQTMQTKKEVKDNVETSVTTTNIERDEAVLPKRDPNSVFPSFFAPGLERNPKTVLLLDDYKPKWRSYMRSAIEAASNAGGLIIATSNFGNILNLSTPSDNELAPVRIDFNASPEERARTEAAVRYESTKLTQAFASRVASGFIEIPFTGIDHRRQESFWTDMIEPEDFR